MTSNLHPRVYAILSVLNDLKDAFLTLLEKPNKNPSLLMIYAFVDICASLARKDTKSTNKQIFTDYVKEFATIGRGSITEAELWAARSTMLHTFSPLGHHTGLGKSKPVFYYYWPEKKEDAQLSLEKRGYSNFALLSIEEIKSLAIWMYNGMMRRVETDPSFRERVIVNAQHLLLDQSAYRVEDFLKFMETLNRDGHTDSSKSASDLD